MLRADFVDFLHWVLPRLDLDCSGFRPTQQQLQKRLDRRRRGLGLASFEAYRAYTLDHEVEWRVIDSCCRITSSCFYRDREVFDGLASEILPRLARQSEAEGRCSLRAWSAGCGGGEEPYSLALAWTLGSARTFPRTVLEITATDIDEVQLARARSGCYRPSALRELPPAWSQIAFVSSGPLRCLWPEYRNRVRFLRQDLRSSAPHGPFDLILCRNLAFTYFDEARQRGVLAMLLAELAPGGFLVLGRSEALPEETPSLRSWTPGSCIFVKEASPSPAADLCGST